ncbi:MAG: sigma-70 family RNA polymerase sigma factor [Candidatus Methylomirabilales bacterium]
MTQKEDLWLLEGVAKRDEAALNAFYDRYHRLVYSLALRVVASTADAEDVVLDVFWQVWQQAGKYDPERGSVITWLITIARSRAIDRLRRLRRNGTLAQTVAAQHEDPAKPLGDPEEHISAAEQRQRVRAALELLPEPNRRALELAYYEGLSQSEIAAALDEPLGTVKTRIRTGLAHLRGHLQTYL